MKFLTKINRNYLMLLTVILIVVSVSGYFILHAIILSNTKESLLEKGVLIENQISQTGETPNIYPVVEVNKIDRKTIDKPIFNEIDIKNEKENEIETFIEYSSQVKIKETFYAIKLRQSEFESEDLFGIIAIALFVLLLCTFGISFFITKRMNKTVWADFEANLHEIEKFNFTENKILNLLNSPIDEFDRLNRVIDKLTEKLKTDYLSLKEFTENASHEIQTPLSIVLLNLEEVLQKEPDAEIFKKVVSSINAIKRLSTLNQSLIMLTKIENRQFATDKVLVINDIIKRKLEEFTPLFETKKLNIELQQEHDFALKMNEQLAELLINNLLSNAVNHNITGGNIKISVYENELRIFNSGEPNTLTNETVFNRFVKGNSKSNGLGLAIVKNICETHNLDIHYLKNDYHCFIIQAKEILSNKLLQK